MTVQIHDDGGTANGGVDTSAAITFTLTITPVNDPPTFNVGGNVTALEDSGAYSAAQVTAISPGPADEAGQTVSFNVSNDNNALFSVQPAIDAAGVLTFTTAADAFGSATVTVTATDNGAPPATSAGQTFTITINAANDAPVVTTSGGTTAFVEDGPAVAIDGALTVTDVDSPTLSGATVTISNLLDVGFETLAANTGGTAIIANYAAPRSRSAASTRSQLSDRPPQRHVQKHERHRTHRPHRHFQVNDAPRHNMSNIAAKTVMSRRRTTRRLPTRRA